VWCRDILIASYVFGTGGGGACRWWHSVVGGIRNVVSSTLLISRMGILLPSSQFLERFFFN
jgi:hypothetical protein